MCRSSRCIAGSRASVVFLFAISSAAVDVSAQIVLVPGRAQFLTQAPQSVAAADFDQDGFEDAVVIDGTSSHMTILFGDGALGFRGVQRLNAGRSLHALVAADIDGDGRPEILAADPPAARVVQVKGFSYCEPCGDYFTWTGSVKVGALPFDLGIGNFDGRGDREIVTVNDGRAVTALGVTNLFACAGGLPGGGAPRRLLVADLNSDGLDDVVTINTRPDQANDFSVFLNDGAAQFCAPTASFVAGADPQDAAVGDFNNDGVPDLLVLTGDDKAIVLLNRTEIRDGKLAGTGQLDPNRPMNLYCSGVQGARVRCLPRALTVADYDADGSLDFAVVYETVPVQESSLQTPGLVSVFPGGGNGSFGYSVASIEIGFNPSDIVSSDFTNDGIPDLVVAEPGSQAVQIVHVARCLGCVCNDSRQCASGLCVDGVCCATQCEVGERCDVPGHGGECAPGCPGDCDRSGEVIPVEVLQVVLIALGDASLVDCLQGDRNRDGSITVDEIIAAVGNASPACVASQWQ